MGFIFEDNDEKDVTLRRVSSIINSNQKLTIYLRMDSDLNPRPINEFDIDDADIIKERSINKLSDMLFQYGDRYTRLTEEEFTAYVTAFCKRWSYKFGNLLLTEMQDYAMIDNYNKKSTITTVYDGTESNKTTYNGQTKNELTKSGSESHEVDYAGSEKDKNVRTGSVDVDHGMNTTDKVNGTNNSDTLRTKNKTENSGTDTTEYNSLTDETTKTFTNRKDTSTDSFTNRKDTNVESFTDRNDESVKSFNDRIDTVTERTFGNIGVTTSSQMLQDERVLSNFSIWNEMFSALVREVSYML